MPTPDGSMGSLGQSLDDALQGMAERCNDAFMTAMVIALVVGRRTGVADRPRSQASSQTDAAGVFIVVEEGGD